MTSKTFNIFNVKLSFIHSLILIHSTADEFTLDTGWHKLCFQTSIHIYQWYFGPIRNILITPGAWFAVPCASSLSQRNQTAMSLRISQSAVSYTCSHGPPGKIFALDASNHYEIGNWLGCWPWDSYGSSAHIYCLPHTVRPRRRQQQFKTFKALNWGWLLEKREHIF